MNAHARVAASAVEAAETRVGSYDWPALTAELDGFGCAVLEKLLSREECRQIAGLYPQEQHFRSHIHMARHGFGKGEYRYFRYPLPDLIGGMRSALYPRLAEVANRWNERMGQAMRYPATHAEFLDQCHDAGQTRPTPLLLQYVPGDFNCLHQDLYGDLAFPLQVAILLSEPGKDFTGGEFALTEQRPRMQAGSRWCRCARATPLSSPSTTGRYRERKAIAASICATASAACAQACATPSASSFMMRSERRLMPPNRADRQRLRVAMR